MKSPGKCKSKPRAAPLHSRGTGRKESNREGPRRRRTRSSPHPAGVLPTPRGGFAPRNFTPTIYSRERNMELHAENPYVSLRAASSAIPHAADQPGALQPAGLQAQPSSGPRAQRSAGACPVRRPREQRGCVSSAFSVAKTPDSKAVRSRPCDIPEGAKLGGEGQTCGSGPGWGRGQQRGCGRGRFPVLTVLPHRRLCACVKAGRAELHTANCAACR